jgi:mannose-6-phosphate isomerase-like protein (cupin superfamily)
LTTEVHDFALAQEGNHMAEQADGHARYVISMDSMESFYDEPGERGWIMEGFKHGFELTSVVITSTEPGGGPPLHTHETEEIHVLPECHFAYVMGEQIFEVHGPCAVNIPARLPHTFLNLSSHAVRLVAFWPHNDFWTNYDELGTNPLLQLYGVTEAAPAPAEPQPG